MSDLPPGAPTGEHLERELADVVGGDGSLWTYSAEAGGYRCVTDPDRAPCRDAAAVAFSTGGDDGVVRQARPQDYPVEDQT